MEEIDGRLAIVDTSPTSGARVVRFWVDEPSVHEDNVGEARSSLRNDQVGLNTPTRRHTEGECSRESPEFGGGVGYLDLDPPRRERLPEGTRESTPTTRQNNIPPEDQNPRGCSLHSLVGMAAVARFGGCKVPKPLDSALQQLSFANLGPPRQLTLQK